MHLREHLREHFLETKSLLKKIPPTEVAYWFLKEGYFPERYVLPPSFKVSDFKLLEEPYNKDLSDLTRRQIAKISYPKTLLTSREFGIIHPWNYHDIVFHFYENWDLLVLFRYYFAYDSGGSLITKRSRKVQTCPVIPAAIAGVLGRHVDSKIFA